MTSFDEELAFVLPRGFRDERGDVHREGVLRAALVADELRVLGDFRVYLRPASFVKVALARTIQRLGSLSHVDVGIVERLADEDLRYLEELYRQLNGYQPALAAEERGASGERR